jgi:hypothetical protein
VQRAWTPSSKGGSGGQTPGTHGGEAGTWTNGVRDKGWGQGLRKEVVGAGPLGLSKGSGWGLGHLGVREEGWGRIP